LWDSGTKRIDRIMINESTMNDVTVFQVELSKSAVVSCTLVF